MTVLEPFSCCMIGEDSLLIQCAEILLAKGHTLSCIISSTPQITRWAEEHDILCSGYMGTLETIAKASRFEYLFSIANSHILSKNIIGLPSKYAINWHNSPLPRFAGIHATSWAILNDEKIHGVTWHLINEVIDAGAILKQVTFPIDKTETALSLNLKCYEYGIQTFTELIEELSSGKAILTEQDLSKRSYYSLNRKAPQHGVLDWNKSAEEIDRLYRALTFGNYSNPLGLPKILIGENAYIVQELRLLETSSPASPGTIVVITDKELEITTTTQNISIRMLKTQGGDFYSIDELIQRYDLTVGQQLPVPEHNFFEQLENSASHFFKTESYWANQLAQIVPGNAPLSIHTKAVMVAKAKKIRISKVPHLMPSNNSMVTLLTTLLIYLYRLNLSKDFTLQMKYPGLSQRADFKPFFSTEVPFSVQFLETATFNTAREQVRAQFELLKSKKSYSADIWQRYPELQNVEDSTLMTLEIVDDIKSYEPGSAPFSIIMTADGTSFGIFANEEMLSRLHLAYLLKNMPEHILTLLQNIQLNENILITGLSILTKEEQQKIFVEWNNTKSPFPEKTVHQLFEEQVMRTPNQIAVLFEDKTLTFRELNQKANQLARYLKKHDILPETPIALCTKRSLEMVIGILAILKAGAAYVPIEPDCPAPRLDWMLKDCAAPILLLNDPTLKQQFSDYKGKIIEFSHPDISSQAKTNFPHISNLNHLVYVLYTSGTTGNPKGVAIEHRSLLNHMNWMAKNYDFSQEDIFLQKTPFSFDASVWEFFAPLIVGGKLIIAPVEAHSDPNQLVDLIKKNQVTVIQLVPAMLREFLEQENVQNCRSLKHVFCGGEALLPEVVRLFFKRFSIKLHNLYGPTETTIDATSITFKNAKSVTNAILIGKPINNTTVYVLDRYHAPVPVGSIGELYIGGFGLARGYLNQKNFSSKKFTESKFPLDSQLGNRLYQTGDLVRWLPDGNLEYLGRCDEQIKIHGYRVELGEIENALMQYELIQQCALNVQEYSESSKFLVAYLVLKPGARFDYTLLRNFLKDRLPEYMIPVRFVMLDKLPLTFNGKVNRKMLPKLSDQYQLGTKQKYVAPTNYEELTLASIWQSVLGIKHIGIFDNFFDLGGHSLSALRILTLIKNHFSIKLRTCKIFELPTIVELANELRKEQENPTTPRMRSSIVAWPSTGFKRPIFLFHPIGGTIFWYKNLVRYLGNSRAIYAYQDPGIDAHEFLFDTVEQMATFYLSSIREIQPRGPYSLVGASFGATLAVEVAKQLADLGEKTSLIGLLDGWAFYPQKLDEREFFEKLMLEQYARIRVQFINQGIHDTDFLLKLQWRRKMMLLKYQLPILDNRLTLFKAEELWPIFKQKDSPLNWWEEFSTKPIDVHLVPGNHETMFWEPHIQVLTKKINEALNKYENEDNQQPYNKQTKLSRHPHKQSQSFA